MSDFVNIENLEIIKDFKDEFNNFIYKIKDMLNKIENEIKKTFIILEDRKNYWIKEYNYWKDIIDNKNDKEDEDLSYEYRKLNEAEENINKINYWIDRVNESYRNYYNNKKIIEDIIAIKAPKTFNFLNIKYEELSTYFNSINFTSNKFDNSIKSSKNIAESTNKKEKQISLSDIPIWAYKLPQNFRWVNISEIDISKLPEFNDINYHHASYTTIKNAYIRFINELLPLIQSLISSNSIKDYIRKVDYENKIYNYPESLESIYDMFFGNDHIYLSKGKNDKLYTITNGMHRIKVALDLSISYIPAITKEV